MIAGGSDTGALIEGGVQSVFGLALSANVSSGGSQLVFSGGVASGSAVSGGGSETVLASGVASDTTVSSGGALTVSSGGVADPTVILSTEFVYPGAVASVPVLDGGTLVVGSGGTIAGTIALATLSGDAVDGVGSGTVFDLEGMIANGASYSGTTLTLFEAQDAIGSMTVSTTLAEPAFALAADGSGGTLITVEPGPAPATPTTPVSPFQPVSGTTIADTSVFTVSGSGTPGDTVTIYDGDHALGSATVGSGGTWSVTTTPLTAGNVALVAVQTDTDGASGSPSPVLNVEIPPNDLTDSDVSSVPLQDADGQIWQFTVADSVLGGGNVGNAGDGWNLVAANDFYGDLSGNGGGTDLVVQDTDGQIWMYQGDTIGGGADGGANVGNYGASWQVVGSGNFFSDGDMGLALQDTTTGQIYLLDMAGNSVAGAANIGSYGAGWDVVGTGDFYGDGNTDLVLQDTTGQIYLDDVNNTVVGSADIGNYNANGAYAWQVVGTGNFTSDGNTDIVLQDTTGQIELLDVQGNDVVGWDDLGNFGAAWQVKSVGEFFGDGHEGLALQNTDGQVYVVETTGTTVTGGANVGNYGTSWSIPPRLG